MMPGERKDQYRRNFARAPRSVAIARVFGAEERPSEFARVMRARFAVYSYEQTLSELYLLEGLK
jgi:hypothetical protein